MALQNTGVGSSNNKKLQQYWFWLPALIPVCIYFFTINKYALNLPYADDHDAILYFLIKYKQATGLWQKAVLLFSLHNEHRILPSRIVYALYYKLTGTVNFRHLIFIANLQLIVIFAVVLYFLKQFVQRWFAAIVFVAALVLFDLNSYENADWAMAGMQNYGVVMWFLLSLFFYYKNARYALIAAIICQVMCAFSSGNGMIAGFTVFLFNAVNKDKRKALISLSLFLLCTVLYFTQFTSPQVGHGASILQVIPFFLHTAGANFGFKVGIPGAIVLLAALVLFFPLKKKWELDSSSKPLLAILLFVFASMGITAIFRAGISMDVAYSTRYFIYPHLLLIIVFCFMIKGIKNEKLLRVSVLGSMLVLVAIYAVSYQYGTAGFARIRQCIQDKECYTDERILSDKDIAERACQQAIFCAGDRQPEP